MNAQLDDSQTTAPLENSVKPSEKSVDEPLVSAFPRTCRVDAPAPLPDAVKQEVHELERLVEEIIDPKILAFDCLPLGKTQYTDEGYAYIAWFTIKESGEKFPVNFTVACEETPLDIWVEPEWFSGSIYIILGIPRIQFIERLGAWMDLQWQIKTGKVAVLEK